MTALAALTMLAAGGLPPHAELPPPIEVMPVPPQIVVQVDGTALLSIEVPVTGASVADPSIATVTQTGPARLEVRGHRTGNTLVAVRTAGGRRLLVVRVVEAPTAIATPLPVPSRMASRRANE